MESRVGPGHSSRTPSARARRVRAGILSLALGGVAALASYAALGRLELGPDEQVVRASSASLTKRAAQLEKMEANLDAVLAKAPPKLPPIPKYPPVKKPRVPKPQVITVSYVQDVTYEKGKGKHHKDYSQRQREAERRRAEQQREAERRRAEQQREAERRRAEQQREAEKKRREEHKP